MEFPKWRYNRDGSALIVRDVLDEQVLTPDKDGWGDVPPSPFAKPEPQPEPKPEPPSEPKTETSEPQAEKPEAAETAKPARKRSK